MTGAWISEVLVAWKGGEGGVQSRVLGSACLGSSPDSFTRAGGAALGLFSCWRDGGGQEYVILISREDTETPEPFRGWSGNPGPSDHMLKHSRVSPELASF